MASDGAISNRLRILYVLNSTAHICIVRLWTLPNSLPLARQIYLWTTAFTLLLDSVPFAIKLPFHIRYFVNDNTVEIPTPHPAQQLSRVVHA